MINVKKSNFERAANKQLELQQWCKNTWSDLYRYVYYRVQNREEAEDVTQEAYERALAKFTSPDKLPTQGYLKTIALNLVRDRWRRQKVHGTQVALEDVMLTCQSEEEATVNRNLIRELMDQLPDDQRTVLQLRLVEGYSRAETAQRMGKSEDAVRGLQYRGLQALRSLMSKNLEEVDRE